MNVVTLIGVLKYDPKVGQSQNGKSWAFLNVGVAGWGDKTDFFNIKCFGYSAEQASKLHEKDIVEIVGRLGKEKPKDGGEDAKWEMIVVADKVAIFDPLRSSDGDNAPKREPSPRANVQNAPPPPAREYVAPPANNDDLPF